MRKKEDTMKNTRKKKIPLFKNEDEEREFWAKNSPLDFMDAKSVDRGTFPNLKPTMKSISIRNPENMLEQLKILAHKRDVPYQSLVKLDEVEQVETMAQEFGDRFGILPEEVQNLLYTLRIKVQAARAGIESITTEDRQIVLRRFQGMHFNRQQLETLLKEGIKLGSTQLRLNPRRLGTNWQRVLEEILERIG